MKISEALKNEQGGLDLGSIMTGVVIIGITGGVVAATTLGLIPFIQDNSAQSSLKNLSLAQTGYKQGKGVYGNMDNLVKAQLIDAKYAADPANLNIAKNGELCTKVSVTGGHTSSSLSSTGKYYLITNINLTPVEVTKAQTCFV